MEVINLVLSVVVSLLLVQQAFNSMGQRAILALNHRQHQTSIIPRLHDH